MHKVKIADFVMYAQEKRKRAEAEKIQKEIDTMELLTKIYRAEIIRMILSVAILFCGCLILEAISH